MVGYQADFAPFMVDEDGPCGLVIDRLVPLLTAQGVRASWVALALTEQLPALESGDVDMLAGLGVTAERAEQLVFGPALVRTGGALFRLTGAADGAYRIATPSSGPLRLAVTEAFPESEVELVQDYPAALNAVVEGSAAAAALNFHVGWEVAERLHPGGFVAPEEPFAPVDLAPAALAGHECAGLLARLAAASSP